MNVDQAYLSLLEDVLTNGRQKGDRTGTGTIAAFGRSIRYSADPSAFPVLTTKRMFFRGVVEELLWFLRGETNIKPLVDAGVNIWVGNAYKRYASTPIAEIPIGHRRVAVMPEGVQLSDWTPEETHLTEEEFVAAIKVGGSFAEAWGELGPVYGAKWRNFGGVDQLKEVVETLRTNPNSRRMVVSAWDPVDVPNMTLPPCHFAWQVQSEELTDEERVDGGPTRRLNLCFTMRSLDLFLGASFDMASYALLLNLLAIEVNMVPGDVVMFVGDAHIYATHLEYVKEQIERDPLRFVPPRLVIAPKSIFSTDNSAYTSADIKLEGYEAYPNWKNVPLAT